MQGQVLFLQIFHLVLLFETKEKVLRVLANPNTHAIDIYTVRVYKLSLQKKKFRLPSYRKTDQLYHGPWVSKKIDRTS